MGYTWHNTEEDFWDKVDIQGKDECWEWQASTDIHGYGQFRFEGKYWKAHRLSWIFTNGDIENNLHVLHDPINCKNKSCVNPNHLRLGTEFDNKRDPDFAITNWSTVRYIREQYKLGRKQTEIAKETGLTKANVWAIIHNISWSEENAS